MQILKNLGWRHKMQKVNVKETTISVMKHDETDYISITDIAKFKSDEPNATIGNWLRNRNTIEYLGIWETLYNPDFKPLEFEGLERKPDLMLLQCLLQNGLSIRMQKDLL